MGLNIKNERVHALAREAARRTGRSQTSVLELALEQLLSTLDTEAEANAERRLRETMEIAAFCASRLSEADRSFAAEELYDENGLPV